MSKILYSHKNAVVRKATAALLEPAIERLGVGRLLGGPREIAEKVIPVIEKFTTEGSSETRLLNVVAYIKVLYYTC